MTAMGRYKSKERNEDIVDELETEPALEYTGKQRHNCRDHTDRMAGGRTPNRFCRTSFGANLRGVRHKHRSNP